jgi:hypothetical protein
MASLNSHRRCLRNRTFNGGAHLFHLFSQIFRLLSRRVARIASELVAVMLKLVVVFSSSVSDRGPGLRLAGAAGAVTGQVLAAYRI